RQYEDFVKRFINQPPTPSGYVYYLPNPKQNKPVSYDDCHWKTGIMAEIKGFTFAERLTSGYDKIKKNAEDQIMKQAARQVQASGGRPIIWIFAEEEAAQIVRKLF